MCKISLGSASDRHEIARRLLARKIHPSLPPLVPDAASLQASSWLRRTSRGSREQEADIGLASRQYISPSHRREQGSCMIAAMRGASPEGGTLGVAMFSGQYRSSRSAMSRLTGGPGIDPSPGETLARQRAALCVSELM